MSTLTHQSVLRLEERDADMKDHGSLHVTIVIPVCERYENLLDIFRAHTEVLERRGSSHEIIFVVDAGFEDGIMFGTDFVVWPDAIDISVQSVTTADFLTKVQVKKILYDNASRFLPLTEEEMKAHHSW